MTMEKSTIFSIAVLSFLLMNSITVSAITASMGNSRMVLYPEVNGWTTTTIEKTILVKNVNDISLNMSLKVDDTTPKGLLEVIDKEFVLAPGEEKKAQFKVYAKKEGTFEGKINVFFKPTEGKESGVVLPSTIIVIAKKNQDYQDNGEDNNSTSSNNTLISRLTGGVVGNGNSTSMIVLTLSTVILGVVLIGLLFVMKRKKHAKEEAIIETKTEIVKKEKIGGKRGGRINETKNP
jgi:hypothetical protein